MPGFDVRVVILANGCEDATVEIAQSLRLPKTDIVDLQLGGKSRTWNEFVHKVSRCGSDVLIFCDADIYIPDKSCLRRLSETLQSCSKLWVVNSQPIKDIVHNPNNLSIMEKVIGSAGAGLDDWKTSICGQLYAMPAHRAKEFYMPIGLPVEDGFLRAMILTDVLVNSEDFSRISGVDGIFHVYESERTIRALIRHQERIVIGSAVNTACFSALRNLPESNRKAELALAAAQELWLTRTIQKQLPKWSSGYVPTHFLFKRILRFTRHPRNFLKPKKLLLVILGFGFDIVVYVKAQRRMWSGVGSGFW